VNPAEGASLLGARRPARVARSRRFAIAAVELAESESFCVCHLGMSRLSSPWAGDGIRPGEKSTRNLSLSRNGRLNTELFGIDEVDVLCIEEREPSIGSDCRENPFPSASAPHRRACSFRSRLPRRSRLRKSSEEVATKRVHPEIRWRGGEHTPIPTLQNSDLR